MFGSRTESVITRNIPAKLTVGIWSRVVLVLYILCTYPFLMYPLAQTIDRTIAAWIPQAKSELKHGTEVSVSNCQYYTIRLVLVTLTVSIAVLARDFGSFISLIGWSCTGTLGLILPGYMMIKFNGGKDLSSVMYFASWALFIVGTIMSIGGTIGSVLEIIHGE